MQNRMIAVGVLVFGACAVGAGVWVLTMNPADEPVAQVAKIPIQRAIPQAATPAYDPYIEEQLDMNIPDQSNRAGRGGQGGGRGGDMFGRMEEMVNKYDLDGDGILSAEERKAMRDAMRAEFMNQMDLDGDGEISLEERVAATRDRILNSDRGERMSSRFDADGDGVLSETELAAMDASIMEREQERMARDIERYDTDGDGVLSAEERAVQQEQRDSREERRIQEFSAEFDEDGDGNLNEDERVSAFSTMRDRIEIGQFLNRYDTNRDQEIGTTEYETFLSSYEKKEPFADVTRDGEIDAEDIVAFRDFVERAKAIAP